MPVMDGFEFVRSVRTDAVIADTPVIFLTANFPPKEVSPLAHALGVRRTLMKTSSAAEVLSAVREAECALTPPNVAVADGEFRREHFRLISAKLAEEFGSLASAFGDLLTSNAPAPLKPEEKPEGAGDLPDATANTPDSDDAPANPDPGVSP